ncbi:MAG TPA: ABC transporter permease [Methylomirabilota bacterium]|nr:ABC transporter permease [Methylomirabilota bacterium]
MNIGELLTLSLHALRANKMRSILTMLGVIIGVFAVILLVSIGSGLQSYITNQISGLGSNLIFVIPGRVGGARTPGGQQTNKLVINDAKRLDTKLKTIADVGPIVQKIAIIKYKNKSDKDASIFGTTSNYPQIIANTIMETGSFFTASQERSGARVAVIGQTVKQNLFDGKSPIGEKISIAGNRYIVIGVVKARGSVFGVDEDNTAIIPINAAQRQFSVTTLNTIYLSAKKPDLVPLVKKEANTILLKRLTEDDFTLQTQEQTLSTISNVIGALTVALGGIATISLVVGGIGVMNIMLVSVTERTKEIGLRKALGARRKDILSQFLFEAVMLCVAGGIIGIGLGLGASYILAKFFISSVTTWSVFLAFAFSVAVGIVFGMMPAYRASRLSPIEALRYE